MAIGKVIGLEGSDNEGNIEKDATLRSVPSSNATFIWENVTKYIGPRDQSVGNCGPQNEAQNETHYAKVFKIFLLMNWWN